MLPPPFDNFPVEGQFNLRIEKGQTLFRQDGNTAGLFYIRDGGVDLLRHTASGTRIVIHRAKQAETFAEASLFSNAYHCDAVASENSELVRLEKEAVLHQFKSDPNFAQALAARFASQVQIYRRRLELTAIRGAQDRVFAALVDGTMTGTVTSFAAEIGLTHEATYRALAALVRKGLVRKRARGQYETLPKTSA